MPQKRYTKWVILGMKRINYNEKKFQYHEFTVLATIFKLHIELMLNSIELSIYLNLGKII